DGGEQRRVLLFAPLPPTGIDEHVEVGEFRGRILIGTSEVALEHEDNPVRGHGLPDHAQDCNALLLLPVVQDRLEQICVGSRWNALEEAAADDAAPIAEAVEERSRVR